MPVKGIKKQALGGALFCLGSITALLSRIIGFELDMFYVVSMFIGACLFLYGVMQTKQHILTSELQHYCWACAEPDATKDIQPHRTDTTVCANVANHPASMRHGTSAHSG